MALCARLFGLPLALMEPNCDPGLANRLVGPVAQRVYTAFKETERYFSAPAVMSSGVALRAGFGPSPYRLRSGEPLRVLILGGSQGAKSLNEIVAPAVAQSSVPLSVVHQVGRGHLQAMRETYAALSRVDVTLTEFIDDMPSALQRADLVISRAGGGAIAEVCAVGRPSLLVPLPLSGDHQLHNARAIERVGAAVCLPSSELSAESLATTIAQLSETPARLGQMAASAATWGRPGAAYRVAQDLLRLAGLGAQVHTATPDASCHQPANVSPPAGSNP
jgi:UDP-N-acetylglucosamine--N-acetylmuramyl-(pentapeptide) pyrophosphoryl-undecaprenol N-acetylglucosamine transferase